MYNNGQTYEGKPRCCFMPTALQQKVLDIPVTTHAQKDAGAEKARGNRDFAHFSGGTAGERTRRNSPVTLSDELRRVRIAISADPPARTCLLDSVQISSTVSGRFSKK